jgi:flagellar hook-length control protein FliK
MNLNSYLPLPTAPRAANPLANSPVQGPASGTDAVAGQGLGLDFAQIMARQFQQLPAAQRQNFAATSDAIHADNAQASEHAALLANKDVAAQTDKQDKSASTNNARVSQDAPGHANDKQESSAKASSGNTARNRRASADPQQEDKDHVGASGQVDLPRVLAVMPSANSNSDTGVASDSALGIRATRTAANLAAQELAQASDAATNKLQMFALSPKVRIITDPRQAPSPESLTAFAKSMGLDDATIQNLMGTASAQTATSSDASASAALTGSGNNPANGSANPSGFPISALLGAALNGGSDKLPISQADAPAFSQAMTQALSSGAQSPVANANLLQSAAASPLNFGISGLPTNGMSQAEMASIQQIQMTVLPPAVLPVQSGNASQAPSTASVLSLLGGNVQEQDIASLASSFSQNMGEPSDSSGSNTSGQSSSGFAQAMAQSSASDTRAVANKDATSAVATPMSEVYDQLSDKLATEMAARMHKQLSDGQWKMKFGLRPAHLGGVEIQLEMKDGKLDAVFRAENPMTRDLLQNSTQRLRDALQNFGINAGFVQVGQNGGQSQQNGSGNSTPQPQVRDNSNLSTNNSDTTAQVATTRGKDSSSLLDLYA